MGESMTRNIINSVSAFAGVAVLALMGMIAVPQCRAQGVSYSPPAQGDLADKVGIDQKLDKQVPFDVAFKDETGKDVKIGDYFGKHPVIFVMPFYRCAGTCILEMEGLMRVSNALN